MNNTEYLPIRVSTLRGDQKISFDAYVRVAGKYILYCRQGSSFEGERLTRLKEKKLNKMYITRAQEKSYRDYMNENINRAFESSDRPIHVRAEIIQGVQQAAAEDLMDNPDNDAYYNVAKEGARRFIDFFLEENMALKELLKLENTARTVGHHGVAVSVIALAIAEEMGFLDSRPMEIPSLIVGCMIHDIGQFKAPITLNTLPENLTGKDKAMFVKHALHGISLIDNYVFYEDLVKAIVAEHEEHMDGTGYPNGLKEEDIDDLVFIAAVANAFDRYINFENYTPKEALKKMLIEKMGVYPLRFMQALQDALKHKQVI